MPKSPNLKILKSEITHFLCNLFPPCASHTKNFQMRSLFVGLMVLVSIMIAVSSCHLMGGERISGNGAIITQTKNVDGFQSIDASGSVKVHIMQNDNTSVKIETDENLLPYLEVYTEGSTLVIKTKRGYNLHPSKEIIAYVVAPSFKSIDLSGSCDLVGDAPITGNEALRISTSGSGDINMDVNMPQVTTRISGSGSISLRGTVSNFEAHVSGSGDIRCFELKTENTKLDLSGSADAEVNASKTLDVQASGASDIRYRGDANVSQHTSGSGSVKKVG